MGSKARRLEKIKRISKSFLNIFRFAGTGNFADPLLGKGLWHADISIIVIDSLVDFHQPA